MRVELGAPGECPGGPPPPGREEDAAQAPPPGPKGEAVPDLDAGEMMDRTMSDRDARPVLLRQRGGGQGFRVWGLGSGA